VNLYLTFDNTSKIGKCFLNLRKYLIINSNDVIDELGFTGLEIDDCTSFIINEEICKMIKSGSSGRKLLSIVYSNHSFTDESIRALIHYAEGIKNIDKVILLTEHEEHEDYYELFEEVMFFPTLKKVHIIECQSYPAALLDRTTELKNLDNSYL